MVLWLQYVFALTRGADGLVGGKLYRSDYYGKADTWDDRTNEMSGKQHSGVAGLA